MEPQEISLTQLSLQQLNQLSQKLDEELDILMNSMQNLKVVQQKFSDSQEAINRLHPLGSRLQVPLTGTLYVAGTLTEQEYVVVDIGTGYYVRMKRSQAADYFKRRIEFVSKQMEDMQPALQQKHSVKQAVMEVLQTKVKQAMAQKPAGATAP